MLKRKLLIVTVLSMLGLICLGSFGIYGMWQVEKELQKVYESDFIPMHLIAEADRAMLILDHAIFVDMFENTSQTEEVRKNILIQRQILQERMQELLDISSLTGDEIDILHNLEEMIRQTIPLSEDLISLIRHREHDKAQQLVFSELKPLLKGIDEKMQFFFELQKVQAMKAALDMKALYSHYLRIFVILNLLIVSFWIIASCFHFIKTGNKHRHLIEAAEKWFHLNKYTFLSL